MMSQTRVKWARARTHRAVRFSFATFGFPAVPRGATIVEHDTSRRNGQGGDEQRGALPRVPGGSGRRAEIDRKANRNMIGGQGAWVLQQRFHRDTGRE